MLAREPWLGSSNSGSSRGRVGFIFDRASRRGPGLPRPSRLPSATSMRSKLALVPSPLFLRVNCIIRGPDPASFPHCDQSQDNKGQASSEDQDVREKLNRSHLLSTSGKDVTGRLGRYAMARFT